MNNGSGSLVNSVKCLEPVSRNKGCYHLRPYSLLAIKEFIRRNTMNLEEMKVQFDAIRRCAFIRKSSCLKELDQNSCTTIREKGPITEVLKSIKNLANEEEETKVGLLPVNYYCLGKNRFS